ncbi:MULTISPECIES: cytochrome c oxidase assembly protein [Streptomyces]|jgi:putative membrane protein/putative copper resistance protein D|uniref:cytochrome c oxidase assembly protein n=1 Tax=Streptomyces TaxID=1883 RepID=UPI0006BA7393|nr:MULTISPECIES: cytochrome c oxidase assembly protein [unclassified Streptomyces]KPI19659.1 Cytochrome c oxidase caa3-type, assembly factor CtaG-related protein [Actinobacteria bacterium OK006]MDX3759418.1 cytochrome c oxidase assembly protein [Streptomyces sp. AK02-04a]NMI56639.1 cytochrome c oxidase assembly protein [Streptomyces sp. RLA2-12]QDN56035.1 cytochrome c oxidase assembly protein [Streptomyces sp. S1D4-20]QDN66212.1 cytochrome c oxidase assembly protein [Streptomyces sp. S1D4-14]
MDHSGHGMTMDLPPFTLGRGLEWSADPFFLVACLVGLGLYGWGVVRLARRGDKWSVGRTIAFVLGVLTVMLVMCTKLNDYGMVMFSVHMVQHMVISMLSPILILLGAPITLALRALPVAATRGNKGPRELLLMFLHSRYMRIITHPAFTIPLFIASLYALYFSPIFDFLMGSKTGHIAMMCHFLAVGLVFFWPIMGVDPGPHRPGYLMRMLELFAGMPFHAFFGIALMMASAPMVETYKNPPASLGIDALSDQSAAGGIAWAFSEIPSVLVLIALLFQWYASEKRQARRTDRAADRDGDKELEAYNAYLASLNARGR